MNKGWENTTFGEFADCNPKISIKKGEIIENCEMEDINIGYKFLYPRKGKLYNGSNSKFQNGDTVFARITPCLENGKIAQIKGLQTQVAIGSTEFFVFRGKSKISDNDFIYYLSQSNLVRDTAVNSMTGASGRQRADLKALKKLEITIPKNITHQKRIASILSAYDDLIEVNNKRIELLEQSARELYKEWFVRMRFPNYQNTKFNKGIPEGWKIKNLKFFGRTVTGKTPPTEKNEYYYGDIPFIKTPDMYNNIFVQNVNMYISQKGANSQKKCALPRHSICVSCIGTGGIVCITTAQESHTNQQINSIILNDLTNLEYLYFAIKNLKEIIELVGGTGSTMTNLSKGKFEHLKIIYPKKELIQNFNQKVSPIFTQIENLQKQNQELTAIRDRLLPRLISGKLEVKA